MRPKGPQWRGPDRAPVAYGVSGMRRLVTVGAAAFGLLVAAVAGVTAYQSLHAPLPASSDTSLAPENCAPGPCADVQGYTLWLSDINVNGDLVTMQVKFQNSSASTHASPEDIQLIDASRHAQALHPPLVSRPGPLLLREGHQHHLSLSVNAMSGRLVIRVVTLESARKRAMPGSSSTVQTHAGIPAPWQ